jgi:HSP20 family protein
MNLIYRHPASLWEQMQRDAEQVFNRVATSKRAEAEWMPSVDIQELPEYYLLSADIPGVDPKQIDISVERNILTVKGERQAIESTEDSGFKRIERIYGRFQRRFTLPENADVDNITANGQNGVLEIRIPKQQVAAPRRITVE